MIQLGGDFTPCLVSWMGQQHGIDIWLTLSCIVAGRGIINKDLPGPH